ncbi:hypothetical protein MRX96_034446 [Rhipicephalus microplus]
MVARSAALLCASDGCGLRSRQAPPRGRPEPAASARGEQGFSPGSRKYKVKTKPPPHIPSAPFSINVIFPQMRN